MMFGGMSEDDTPLCGQRLFLYPGNPDGTGIIEYDTETYRDQFETIDFVDSSQFIRSLEDEITLRDRSLLQLTDGERFEIPEYQRNYSWTSDQHDELWETAKNILQLRSQASDKPSDDYFGTIYIAKSPTKDKYEIIDGQQRIATVAIILKNIGDKLDEHVPNVEGDLKEYAKHIRNDYIEELLYRRKGPSRVPFLKLNEHDNEFFTLLFESPEQKAETLANLEQYDGRKQNAKRLDDLLAEVGISEEIYGPSGVGIDEDELETFRYYGDAHENLIDADDYYSAAIDTLLSRKAFTDDEPKVKTLINLAQYILRSLRISECLFETSDQELRIEVFQSLNDRGIELSNMDKVRARIVGRFQGESDSKTQIGRWEAVMREFGTDADAVEEFLSHYLAATEQSFETVTDAKNNLLEAFRLRSVGNKEVESRLANPGDARDFLEELKEYAQRYQELINSDLIEEDQALDEEYREQAEAVLRRLNGLNTKQWRPFVMYVYQQVVESPGKGEFFCEVLRTVESIMFRVAISDHVATVIDDTFPKSTQEFIELEQTGNQFDAQRISEALIENIDSDARQVHGENFADKLISTRNWGNNQAKQLFLKIVDKDFRRKNKAGITITSLSQDTGQVHIEHVFPVEFILRDSADPYAWLENFFINQPDSRMEDRIDLLRDSSMSSVGKDSAKYEELKPLITQIRESFVRDLGNMILLDQEVNSHVQNRLFSQKIKAYYESHEEDMGNIANQYFSRDGDISSDLLETLLETELPDDETAPGLAPVIQEFNEWWHWERSVQRKAELIELILESLTFITEEDEFDSVMPNIESMIRDDYNTRFTLLSA